jgi:hypothetical protein
MNSIFPPSALTNSLKVETSIPERRSIREIYACFLPGSLANSSRLMLSAPRSSLRRISRRNSRAISVDCSLAAGNILFRRFLNDLAIFTISPFLLFPVERLLRSSGILELRCCCCCLDFNEFDARESLKVVVIGDDRRVCEQRDFRDVRVHHQIAFDFTFNEICRQVLVVRH